MKKYAKLLMLFIVSFFLITTISGPQVDIIEITKMVPASSERIPQEELSRRNTIKENKATMKKMIDPVTMLITRESSGFPVGSGTGFSIKYDPQTNESFVLTNAHVCDSSTKDPDYFMTGISSRNHSATASSMFYDSIYEIIASEKVHDLCLLKRKGFLRPVKMAKKPPSQFDKLTTVGGPHGNFPIIQEVFFSGYIARSEAFKDMRGPTYSYMLLSDIYHGGSSGSPVFNEKGEVVGIVFAKLGRYSPIGMLDSYGGVAVQAEEIMEFLDSINFKL